MEFVTAAFLYTVFALFSFGSFWLAGPLISRVIPESILGYISCLAQQICSLILFCIPAPVKRGGEAIFHYLFFQRNHFWLAVYVSGILMCYIIGIMDAATFLNMLEPDKNHVLLPFACLFANTSFLMLCCLTDPGEITEDNFKRYKDVFKCDGILYRKNNDACKTCKTPKIARSKHCGIYNKCIYKFDHYCLWSANDVGGLNHRWFVGFLVSFCVMAGMSIWRMHQALRAIIVIFGLWQVKYIDGTGSPQAMDVRTICQTLFMQFPRLVFLQAVTMMTMIMVLCYAVYHLYLMATNQTTNERYKVAHRRAAGDKMACTSPYNKGLVQNILDDLFPYMLLDKHGKKRK